MRDPDLCQEKMLIGNPLLNREQKLTCFRRFDHSGLHWDEGLQLAWSAEDPREKDEIPWWEIRSKPRS